MPCSVYLPSPLVQPDCQTQKTTLKDPDLPRPGAWFETPRSRSPKVALRKSIKIAGNEDSKRSKKTVTGQQNVQIVKSIWQANMPLLHSNVPAGTNMDGLQKENCEKTIEPCLVCYRSEQRAYSRLCLCRESMNSRNRRQTFAVMPTNFKASSGQKSDYQNANDLVVQHSLKKDLKRNRSEAKPSGTHLSETTTGAMFPGSALKKHVRSSTSLDNIVPVEPAHPVAFSASSTHPIRSLQPVAPEFRLPSAKYYSQNLSHSASPGVLLKISAPVSSSGITPDLNSSECSRCSLEGFQDAVSPINSTNNVSPTRDYDLISPVSAGVFDDSPRLRRNPTFRKQLSISESKMKPLPPAPEPPVAPLVIRRNTIAKPIGERRKPTVLPAEPLFLPFKPQLSDFNSLDEAFRRSGLLEPESRESKCPSLTKVTEELEKQLSRMSSTASLADQTYSSKPSALEKQKVCRDGGLSPSLCDAPLREVQIAAAKPPGTPAALSNQPTRSAAVKESTPYLASRDPALRRSVTISAESLRQSLRTNQQLKHHHSCDSISEVSRSIPAHSHSISFQRLSSLNHHELLCASPISKEKRLSVNRARLRLPRIRTTEFSSDPGRVPVNLSIVVETPSERDSYRADAMNERVLSPATENLWAELSSFNIRKSSDGVSPLPNQPPVPQSPVEPTSSFTNLLKLYSASCTPSRTSGVPDQEINDIPVKAAEGIILRILESVDSLEDLFNLAVLNRAFYTIFKQNELPLIKSTLFRMSPPAWELREMCPPWEDDDYDVGVMERPVPAYTPNLYICHYMRDLCTMVSLKWLILVRCESFLRPETIRALAGQDEERSIELDDAFWRVWTFCRLFGCGKGREEDITAQADWLSGGCHALANNRNSSAVLTFPLDVDSVLFDPPEGFSKGNEGGLTATQLYDMMEIWTCLGVLVQTFHGKRDEARRYGVFDDSGIEPSDIAGEDAILESWTQYLLTLGPSAILTLSSLNPDTPIEDMFARAQSLGWTKWTIPTKAKSGSNRSFLKEAVSRVYDNQLVRGENSPRFHTPTIPEYYPPRRSRSLTPIQRPRSHSAGASISKQRRREFAAELRRKRQQVKEQAVNKQSMLVPEERPISNFQEVIRRLNGSASASPLLPSSHDTIPTVTLTTTNNPPHSTVLTRGLSPTEVEEKISQGRHPSPSGRRQKRHSRSPPPGFVDPADKALQKLVHELGFREEDAKWALKCTDNGESLDVEAAINMLLRRAGKGNASGAKGIGQPPEFVNVEVRLREKNMTAVGETDLVHYPTWRWA